MAQERDVSGIRGKKMKISVFSSFGGLKVQIPLWNLFFMGTQHLLNVILKVKWIGVMFVTLHYITPIELSIIEIQLIV